ncbi:ModD protein [Helicobacter winghamensis]|uniref:Putative pyrophosphorylase ModD n=1 Tax=Helicobacter winghamensis TaxID=157268 RepID=A0A2N3PJT5_9HELI|nr:ModD protein [Helicobacter winghamensis]EEO26289.1 quinolinate phosphoribosyl transferase, C-terminal domain protein [Helicobacter winghamensis ATCC BAA-430]PKT77279.1 ModD protein [Helicobacter winghamensis]PKT77479.1 ModD protein [Helicobacter winghamensis]PKT77788.1 ModD protein [Helicobacter winghamensis]PKT81445.1 ModD protein [Helicobacter winghamensis]
MIYFSDNELIALVEQDVPYLDNTTFGLGISGVAKMCFYPKQDEIVASCVEECARIARIFGLEAVVFKSDSALVAPKELMLEVCGERTKLFRIAKTLQNLLEYAGAVATYTYKMLEIARGVKPDIALLGTRKNMPFAKKFLLKALICGGGIPHRLGLSDSILVFKEHYLACENLKESFKDLKVRFKEHRVIVEVESKEQALKFAELGADVLQCERFTPQDLRELVEILRAEFEHLCFSATGGVCLENVEEYAKSGVDMLVSTSMYRAKICDIKVEFIN